MKPQFNGYILKKAKAQLVKLVRKIPCLRTDEVKVEYIIESNFHVHDAWAKKAKACSEPMDMVRQRKS